jgi:aquaporin Z
MEATEVALYLFFTCILASFLLRPASPVRHFVGSSAGLRALMGVAVGATVIAIITSPWGKQSGGHFNPALTLAFYRLGKIRSPDALFYVVAQFSGAIGGVCAARYLLPHAVGRNALMSDLLT